MTKIYEGFGFVETLANPRADLNEELIKTKK